MKMVNGLLASIAALVIAIFACTPAAKLVVQNTTFDDGIQNSIENALAGQIPDGDALLYWKADEEGLGPDGETPVYVFKMYARTSAGDDIPLDTILANQKLALISKIIPMKSMCQNALGKETLELPEGYVAPTIVNAVAQPLTEYVFVAICFIGIWIVAKILFAIIFAIGNRLAKTTYIVNFANRCLGGAFALVIATALVLVVATITQMMYPQSFMDPVKDAISKTYITKLMFDKNILYDMIGSKIDLNAVLDKVTDMFNK